jgi:hypothetical protein
MANPAVNNPDVVVDRDVYLERDFVGNFQRISWGAVLAGVLLAVITQIALNVLGIAIGFAALTPAEPSGIGPAFDTATVIWIAASTLISVFVGGWAAGYLQGSPDEEVGMVHGLVTWSLATLIALFLFFTTASSILSGLGTALSDGISLVGTSVADVTAEVAPDVSDALNLQSRADEFVNNEVEPLVEDLSEQQRNELANDFIVLVREPADSDAAQNARDSIIDTVAAETELTEDEIETQLQQWENDARMALTQAQERVEEITADLADATAAAAGVLFMMLVIGAFAGGAGGYIGTPHPLEAEAA